VRNRNRCWSPSQSGLNPKYRSGQFPRMEGIAFHRIHEELLNGNFAGDVRFRCYPDLKALI